MEIDWVYVQKYGDWAGHMIEAVIMAGIVAVLLRAILPWRWSTIAALAFSAGHFHGREKRDYEIASKLQPPHLEGYYFWNWSWDNATDFWPTAALCAVLIWAIREKR